MHKTDYRDFLGVMNTIFNSEQKNSHWILWELTTASSTLLIFLGALKFQEDMFSSSCFQGGDKLTLKLVVWKFISVEAPKNWEREDKKEKFGENVKIRFEQQCNCSPWPSNVKKSKLLHTCFSTNREAVHFAWRRYQCLLRALMNKCYWKWGDRFKFFFELLWLGDIR